MKKLALRLAVTLCAFLVGILITVGWIFYCDIPELPPLNRDKLTLSNQEELPEVKRKRGYLKQQLEEFPRFKKVWNTEILKKLKEKPLEKISKSVDESYRFVWIPSFHSPISIRVWKTDNKVFLVAKSASGEGFSIRKLSVEKTRPLTEEEWNKFNEFLDRSAFWTNLTLDEDDEPIHDGAFYVFEGNRNRKFHEVHRITPSKEFRELGAYLINLAELKTEYENY